MARTLVVTVGVSLITIRIPEKEGLGIGFRDLPWGRTQIGLEKLNAELAAADRRHIRQPPQPYRPDDEDWSAVRTKLVGALDALWTDTSLVLEDLDRRRYAGAELASLHCLGRCAATPSEALMTDDEVILIASDTAPGIFCAHVVGDVLREGKAGLPAVERAEIRVAGGLRPEQSELFLAAGLPNAARLLLEALAGGRETLLLGSGGYKGLLPYLVPVAMHLRIPLLYLYEESEELLAIQPLPMKLDLEVVQRNPQAFNLLRPDGSAARRMCYKRSFRAAVERERPADWSTIEALKLVEDAPTTGAESVRLSAAGMLAWLLATYHVEPAAPRDAAPTHEG